MELLEQELLRKGITSINLHVGTNYPPALHLYETQGFKITGHNMKKDLR
jgi:hypothetical protein